MPMPGRINRVPAVGVIEYRRIGDILMLRLVRPIRMLFGLPGILSDNLLEKNNISCGGMNSRLEPGQDKAPVEH